MHTVYQRIAAGATLVFFAVFSVVAVLLALSSIPSLLVAWIGMVVVFFAFSFELRAAGSTRIAWTVVAGIGAIMVVGAIIWLGLSSPWGLLILILAVAAIGVLGSYALRQPAPVVALVSAAHPVLFVNPKSGGGKAADANIADLARQRGIQVRVLDRGDDLTELAADAIAEGADAIGVAGGDGSLGYVATATIPAEVPFICIPAGTRNHFARDLGLNRADIVGALDAFDGEIRMIDYATVNGRVFLNVASLGLYAETVSDPAYRDAKLETLKETLRSLEASGERFDLRFSDEGGHLHETADLIMVSSGRYEIKGPPGDIGKRARMDSGFLGVMTLDAPNPAAAVEAATLWAAGAINRFSGWAQWEALAFDVDSGSTVSIGIDGETVSMEPPLHFVIHEGAFPVAVPRGTPYGPRVSPLGSVGVIGQLWDIMLGKQPKP